MGNNASRMRFSHLKMCVMAFQGPRATKHLHTHFGFKAVGVCTQGDAVCIMTHQVFAATELTET